MKLLLLLLMPIAASAQTETLELGGQLGSRPALLVLHASRVPEGEWQIAGEYIVLTTLQRRFLEGEASPQIRVTSLREGTSPILFGRSPTGELRGTWKGTSFRGTRYAPGGQERERFEFSEDFPSLEKYSANVRCDAGDGQYSSTLNLAVDAGKLRSLDWRSKLATSGHVCAIAGAEQQPMEGGLRFAAGKCSLTLREIGEYIWLAAANCADQCGSQAYLEPLVIDRRGYCRLLRPESTR
ncbi:MAG TPA: hypothetical protein VNU64_00755 [Burkholderiales bacterium]|nr:hypothetical protein [Burkholderiales bacterium]